MEYAFLIVCEYVWVYIGEFQRGMGKKEWEEEEEQKEWGWLYAFGVILSHAFTRVSTWGAQML